jgi:hypothetical protein
MVLVNHKVHIILMDGDNFVNILSRDVMPQMGIDPLRMNLVKTPLIRIERLGVLVRGALKLSVVIGIYPRCITLQQPFMMIDMALAYNIII